MLNLTPHAITIRTPQGDVTFPPSGTVARVETRETDTGYRIAGAPVIRRTKGAVTGIPSPIPDGGVIVSSMVLDAVPGMLGVYAPDTGKTAIRGQDGLVQAVTQWVAA